MLSNNEQRLKDIGRRQWREGKDLTWEMRWRSIKRQAVVAAGGLAVVFFLVSKCDDDNGDYDYRRQNTYTPTTPSQGGATSKRDSYARALQSQTDETGVIQPYSSPSENPRNSVPLEDIPKTKKQPSAREAFNGTQYKNIIVPPEYRYNAGEVFSDRAGYNGRGYRFYNGASSHEFYVGAFKFGMPNGQGVLLQASGRVIKGDFSSSIVSGGAVGEMRYLNGDVFKGEMKQCHGYDSYVQGDRIYFEYHREFEYQPAGWGTMYYASGEVKSGLWNRGKWVAPYNDNTPQHLIYDPSP